MNSGQFVEIGAFDGVSFSNSFGLGKKNWFGLFVEPIPTFAKKCRENWATFPNVSVIQIAIGRPGTHFISLQIAGSLTTGNQNVVEAYKKINWSRKLLTDSTFVSPSCTLDQLLTSEGIKVGFDLLVIDVEGAEDSVFSGFDIANWRPKMIIVELSDTHPDLAQLSEGHAGLSAHIIDHSYLVAYRDQINCVFVRRDIFMI
jgi:FkbM family methyltransferase